MVNATPGYWASGIDSFHEKKQNVVNCGISKKKDIENDIKG